MSDDKEIRDIFTRARSAERSDAPSFEQVRRRARDAGRDSGRRVFATAALGTLAAGALIVLAAIPMLRAPVPLDVPESLPAPIDAPPPATMAESRPQPPPLPAKDDRFAKRAPESKQETRPMSPASEKPKPLDDSTRERLVSLGYVAGSDQTSSGSTAAPTDKESIERLPVVGHKFQDNVNLPPGVTDTDGDVKPNLQASRDTGLRYRMEPGKAARVDASSKAKTPEATDPVSGTFGQNLNRDVLEEMEKVSKGATGEYGRADGGFVNIVPGEAQPGFNTESYSPLAENPFFRVTDTPVSTFSIDVDTASYAVVRRFLQSGSLPPRDAVRIEELINYFPSDDPAPRGRDPFAVYTEMADCPWAPGHRLARIALKGRQVERRSRPASNLVFLIDVSGSMDEPNKLPLVRDSLRQLAMQLDGRDEVAIVVYAGSSGVVLQPTRGSDRGTIIEALDRLRAGGSTNGGGGIMMAYALAQQRFVRGGTNRVILATDGDFNVGITDKGELVRFVEEGARKGIFLTVLGFGMGNYKDDMLEILADRGNGNYAYIDSPREAHKALVQQMEGTLITIAKDVKIQVEFNPAAVGAYRLIGYENRMLRREDFNDDRKDAGEIGAGHSVTALYEIVPAGREERLPSVDPLKYQSEPRESREARGSGEMLTVKLRYKEPDGQTSRLIEQPVTDEGDRMNRASDDLRFAAAVASFGMLLRESTERGSASWDMVIELARQGMGRDPQGHRREFLRLVESAAAIDRR